MLLIIGTIPVKKMPLTQGFCVFKNGVLEIDGLTLPLINGTSVVLAAASITCEHLGIEKPYAIVAGDIGSGDGSNQIYRFLRNSNLDIAKKSRKNVITMSYLKPNILYAKDVVKALKKRINDILIADSGSMYVAKAAGIAKDFDLFTPDLGEMAFLADHEAIHPAYVRNYIFNSKNDVPGLIAKAYGSHDAAKSLIIKGVSDYVVEDGKIVAQISEPCVPTLEPIGGTGDSLLGIVSALVASGHKIIDSSIIACKTNRLMGALSNPDPATKVWEILRYIPDALNSSIKI